MIERTIPSNLKLPPASIMAEDGTILRAKSHPTLDQAVKAHVEYFMRMSQDYSVDGVYQVKADGIPIYAEALLSPNGLIAKKEKIELFQRLDDDSWALGIESVCYESNVERSGLFPTNKGCLPFWRNTLALENDRLMLVRGLHIANAVRDLQIPTIAFPGRFDAEKCRVFDFNSLQGKRIAIFDDDQEDDWGKEIAKLLLEHGAAYVKFVAACSVLEGFNAHSNVATCLGKDPETSKERLLRALTEDGGYTSETSLIGFNSSSPNGSTTNGRSQNRPPKKQVRAEQFKPFPTHVLPKPLESFVNDAATAIGCDTSFLALPLLSALGAAIGDSRLIQLKTGWTAPPIIWTAIVGESGTAKTPAFRQVLKPTRNQEQDALKEHLDVEKEYDIAVAEFDKALSAWKRSKNATEPPPTKPVIPQADRFIVQDTTVEALAPLLDANPRGLLLARDELAGWFGSFDRYAGSKGADASQFLSMFNGESMTVDRKSGNPRTICIPRAMVSITGGIQPGILARTLGHEHFESGLAARFLLAYPPRKPKHWTDECISPDAEARLAQLFRQLFDLQPSKDPEGKTDAIVLDLDADAKEVWVKYYNEHAKEQTRQSGDLAAAWSKLEEYAARLALVIQCVRNADAILCQLDPIDVTSMRAGIELAEWFKNETRRVYSRLSETAEDGEQRKLVEWIEGKGGSSTVREAQQGHRQFTTSDETEIALNKLKAAGFGDWHLGPSSPKGGHPPRCFRLFPSHTSTLLAETREPEGFVDVDSEETPNASSDDDWGAI